MPWVINPLCMCPCQWKPEQTSPLVPRLVMKWAPKCIVLISAVFLFVSGPGCPFSGNAGVLLSAASSVWIYFQYRIGSELESFWNAWGCVFPHAFGIMFFTNWLIWKKINDTRLTVRRLTHSLFTPLPLTPHAQQQRGRHIVPNGLSCASLNWRIFWSQLAREA